MHLKRREVTVERYQVDTKMPEDIVARLGAIKVDESIVIHYGPIPTGCQAFCSTTNVMIRVLHIEVDNTSGRPVRRLKCKDAKNRDVQVSVFLRYKTATYEIL